MSDELSHYWLSPLGEAACDTCGSVWPCHMSAWGGPDRISGCSVKGCDGTLTWSMLEDAA